MRWLLYILTGIVCSFFIFPFNLPLQGIEINTKLILAVIGLVLFIFDKISKDGFIVSRAFFDLSFICVLISVWAFSVSVWNDTKDFSFAKYFMSVWVWFGAAYCMVRLIRIVHGNVSLSLIGNYLIAVCSAQCILAYSMFLWPSLSTFINSLMGEGHGFMGYVDSRIYGLGASLDPSGLRFSGVLVILVYLAAQTDIRDDAWKGWLYAAAFMVISIFGNMIARSTTIGLLVSIVFYLWLKRPIEGRLKLDRSWGILAGGLLLTVIVSIILYRSDPSFKDNFRFGFEGFFSLTEKGQWETHSTEILKSMIVWPESMKTWLIGDGFFSNPQDLPDRFGQARGGYYMQTDIGYLRYIFYFGLIGLIGMIAVFVQMTITCIRKLPGNTSLFLMLLVVNLIGWLKVSSDIIMVFAPFVILSYFADSELSNEETTSN